MVREVENIIEQLETEETSGEFGRIQSCRKKIEEKGLVGKTTEPAFR